MNPGGHTVVTATDSFKTKSQFELWTSLIHGSKLEEETLKEKMKTGGGEGDELHNFSFALKCFESNHLTRGSYGPTIFQSIGRPHFLHIFASHRCNLCDSATCRPVPPRKLRPDFEAQTRKPSAGSVLHTRSPPSDACHRRPRPAGPPSPPEPRSTHASAVLTRSTPSLHVFLHLLMFQVSATAASRPTSRSLGPSLTSVLHRSRSVGTARPP